MKRIYLIILFDIVLLTAAQAQELTVKSMTVVGNDISASQYERKDLNGKPCALVKVQLAAMGAVFEGNVIGRVDYKTGEYWVYMTAGSKELRIKHPNFVPLAVQFSDYAIKGLESKATYVLTLLMPQGGITPVLKQKLTINYSPQGATVLIDSKFYKGNGRVEAVLPVGSHEYIIAADGYVTAEGTVKLTADGSRTINETLTAIATTQKSKVQQNTEQLSASVQQSAPQQSIGQQSKILQQSSQTQATTDIESVQNGNVETITVNGVSFNMVHVDGGTFMMGATPEQSSDAFIDEKPVHQVTLSTYSIGETEVTQALWQAVMGSNPSRWKDDSLPIEMVSWDDCQIFINKLNELTGKKFRLPTEAEWEYAARGGNKSYGYRYSGSNSFDDVAWYIDNSGKQTYTVKSKRPNELGIYDMSGNVYEWCQDRYGSYSSGSQPNPIGSSSGSARVIRGGGWNNSAWDCRVSGRSYFMPSYRFSYLGFRLAL